VQLLHHEAVRDDGRKRRRRTPFVQRGRAAAQGARALGRAVPQPAARGQHATSRGRGGRAPAAGRPRAPVAVAHVHSARAGRQPETGTAVTAPATAVADHHRRRRRRHRHNGTGRLDRGRRHATSADVVVRLQQLTATAVVDQVTLLLFPSRRNVFRPRGTDLSNTKHFFNVFK